MPAPIVRAPGAARAGLDDTSEPGVYRLILPDPPGGFAYASVVGDARESDLDPLEPAEAARLAEGWPLTFEPDPDRLAGRLFAADRAAGTRSGAASSWPPSPASASRST